MLFAGTLDSWSVMNPLYAKSKGYQYPFKKIKGPEEKFKMFGLAAKGLPIYDKERVTCYVMQMATGISLLGKSG
jgi:hypothetical protein